MNESVNPVNNENDSGATPPPIVTKNRLRFEDEGLPKDIHDEAPDDMPIDDEQTASGQNVPKSKKGKKRPPNKKKLRQDSKEPRPSDRLRHEDAPAGGGASKKQDKKAAHDGDKLNKSKLRMEKSGKKLDSAMDKLKKQKPVKKPGIVKNITRAVRAEAWAYAHGKIYQVEDENVGVKAAHRTELAGERAVRGGARFVKHRIRTRPARNVRKWEKKDIKAKADYHFRKMEHENPELKKNAVSRHFQKKRIKKQYQKQAREAAKKTAQKTAKKTAEKTATATKKVVETVVGFVARHPVLTVILLLCFLLVIIMQSCMGGIMAIGNSMSGAVAAGTYPSEDSEMIAAEAAYAGMEAALKYKLDNYALLNPGFNEYRYDFDDIDHDPYVLISILSALYEGAWTLGEVQGALAMLFDRQYILTETIASEVRSRTETETFINPETGAPITISYQVLYSYYICTVTLENFNLSHLPVYIMSEEGLNRYSLYMTTLGNRPDLFPPHVYPNASTIKEYMRYSIPPEHLSDETFAAMMAEAMKHVGRPYVWGGSKPSTGFDCSGFVSWVLNNSGWDVGRLGARALYGICTPVSPADAMPGDLVFFHSTYKTQTPGISHVGIYVGDGMMIHAGNPIGFADITTNYWVNHFYGYGRP